MTTPDTKAIRAQMEAEAGMRALLRAGCDLLANEYDNLKASITMPDGSLSANPLDAWAAVHRSPDPLPFIGRLIRWRLDG